MAKKRDALAGKHCGTCRFFHNPEGNATGYCVRYPAVPLIGGMAPDPDDLKRQQARATLAATPQQMAQVKMKPLLFSYVPNVGDEDGCWEHQPALESLN